MLNQNQDFLVQVVKGEAVLLNSKTGDYFGLNEVGSDFYQLVDGKKGLEEIIDLLDEEYDVKREVLKADVENLVVRLLEKKILLDGDSE
jgi:hypothetical protein